MTGVIIISSVAIYSIDQSRTNNSTKETCEEFALFDPAGMGSNDDRFLDDNHAFSDIILKGEFDNLTPKYYEYKGLGLYDIVDAAFEDTLK